MRHAVSVSRNSTLGAILLHAIVALTPSVNACAAERTVRIATFNASLYGESAGEVLRRLSDRDDPQARKIASVIQSIRPDVLLINEIDYDPKGEIARLLATHYFAIGQDEQQPIVYPHIYAIPSNTGVDSGMDLNGNGERGDPEDAYGYGTYPGQYAMTIFSRFPINRPAVRTFQHFLWKDLPSALKPKHPDTGERYYRKEVWNRLRLSSKNHVDIPVLIHGRTIHILASHPTPPVFDDVEDHNGCRNHDEIRFWMDYLDHANHLVDDRGKAGGLQNGELFVIMGDLNSDPAAGDSRQGAIRRLLRHQRVQDPRPTRTGSPPSGTVPHSRSRLHTADFGDNRSMRIDYVLPSRDLHVLNSGVFWPAAPDSRLNASDHRPVWIEVGIAE